jgi:hypothetical protein
MEEMAKLENIQHDIDILLEQESEQSYMTLTSDRFWTVCQTDAESEDEHLARERIKTDLNARENDMVGIDIQCKLSVNLDGSRNVSEDKGEMGKNEHKPSLVFEAAIGQWANRKKRLDKLRGHCVSAKENSELEFTRARATYDPGATRCFASTECVLAKGLPMFLARVPLRVSMADGTVQICKYVTSVRLKFTSFYKYATECYVLPMGAGIDFILGMPWVHSMVAYWTDIPGGVIGFRHKVGSECRWVELHAAPDRHEPLDKVELINSAVARKDIRQGRKEGRDSILVVLRACDVVSGKVCLPLQLQTSPPKRQVRFQPRRQPIDLVSSRKRLQGVVDLDHPDVLRLITVDERESLYPFKGSKTGSLEAKEPATVIEPTAEMVKLIQQFMDGTLETNQDLSVAELELEGLVKEAESSYQRRKLLFDMIQQIQLDNHTLGMKFWTKEFRGRLAEELLEEFDDIMKEVLPDNMNIDMNKPSAPVRFKDDWEGVPPYRRAIKLSPADQECCREQLQELLEKGIIRPSASPFGAPVLMVPKPGSPGKSRMVVDYRALNEITVSDKFPLPDVQGIMDSMEGKKFFSTFDLLSGFWQVPVYPPHCERTAMTTIYGQFEWVFMPMGLKNSPAVFQRNMNSIVKEFPFVKCFIDDLIVASETMEEHIAHVRILLQALRDNNLCVKGSKVHLFVQSLKFSGTCYIFRNGSSTCSSSKQQSESCSRVCSPN